MTTINDEIKEAIMLVKQIVASHEKACLAYYEANRVFESSYREAYTCYINLKAQLETI